jgi:dipeptidase
VFVAQLRDGPPAAVGNCLWFAYGPANTSCFVPVHAGVTDLPDRWDHPANFTRIDREQAQWNFRLVHQLVNRLGYQEAIQEVRRMIAPAEKGFLAQQVEVERTAVRLLQTDGPARMERFLSDYARQCATQVGFAYGELVDDLMLRHLVGYAEVMPSVLPTIAVPSIPVIASAGK